MVNMNDIVGSHNLLLLVLDTLRYDVAVRCWEDGSTPNFANILGRRGWEARHAPGNFTFPSHQAMFAGFLPTPVTAGKHPRRFALRFPGSGTIAPETCVFDTPDIISGLASRGYHTICIGGVGFFNKQNPLSCVLPGLFAESHWRPDLGVTDPDSTEHQFTLAAQILDERPRDQRVFLYINVSALHQPNYFYLRDDGPDTVDTQAAALHYVDQQLPLLLESLSNRLRWFGIVCSDHGTAYGEDGYTGHRLSHPVVWTVPYGEFFWPRLVVD